MDQGIRLGRLAGVQIAMSWVVPFVACVYAVTLQAPLRLAVEGQPTSSYWLVSIFGAGLFFLSLLAHEMGHALVGRREGIGVKGITLTLLGGYTQFDAEPPTPGAELRVSGIGPLTNFVLAGAFYVASTGLVAADGFTALVGEMLGWLALVNLLLAALNMLPGAPLDGGAVLGALVWMATRNRTRAQTITATIGLALGLAIAGWGAMALLTSGTTFGFWGLLIGGFIAVNARSRLQAAPTVGALRDTAIGQVMVPDPPVVPEWATLRQVADQAASWQPHTAFPVQAPDGRITGLLTAELVMAVDPQRWPVVRAGEVAWPIDRVPTAEAGDTVLTTIQRSEGAPVDRVLVVWPDGRVAGIAGPDAAEHALRAGSAAG